MTQTDRFVLDFLDEHLERRNVTGQPLAFTHGQQLLPGDWALYHIEEITFEDKSPRKEAFENVLGALRIPGVSFLYLILGNSEGVSFYFGVVRNLLEEEAPTMTIKDIGESILGSSIRGNFRGSRITNVDELQKRNILGRIQAMSNHAVLEGVPGINEESEDIQGVERIMDVMTGEEFGLAILSKPLSQKDIQFLENKLQKAFDNLAPLSKKSIQENSSENDGWSRSQSTSKTDTSGESYSQATNSSEGWNTGVSVGTTSGTQRGTNKGSSSGSSSSSTNSGTSESVNEGTSEQKTSGKSGNSGSSETKGTSTSSATGKSVTEGTQGGSSRGSSTSLDIVSKSAQDWIKYIDEVLLPRLDYGKGKGLFIAKAWLFANKRSSLIRLGHSMQSLYAGKSGNRIPLELRELSVQSNDVTLFKQLQIPVLRNNRLTLNESVARTVLSQYVSPKRCESGYWMSAGELSVMAGLPLKEVVGLSLREEVEFGLNFPKLNAADEKIHLGTLVQSGRILENIQVSLKKSNLNTHTFITGVTGSGKTTTCQKLLIESELPFLVIEPAKTEYRQLAEYFPDLLVFTLGKNTVAPFRLNPFEFFPHESITSRVDMLKAAMEAAFDMEAAIPQVLEAAMYQCYEEYGWNIASNHNKLFEDPFADGVYAFPTLADLLKQVHKVVVQQGFDERLKNDYIGSIRARLQGLLVGAKGMMLNTPRSVDFRSLLHHRVILELEEIKSGSEKSLLMGFILTNHIEALKYEMQCKGKKQEHLTLIEEAHRLLSKFEAGDSLNKKQGVTVFSDMLAEVRKYGEGLIIVDQIPNKLTPEILKNTNTKIVHRIYARDDKEAIGNTIALDDDQKEFLSNLETGRAVVFSQNWPKAVQVQIQQSTDTSREETQSEKDLRQKIIRYYQENWRRGILTGLEFFETMPELSFVENYLNFLQEDALSEAYLKVWEAKKNIPEFQKVFKSLLERFSFDIISNFLLKKFYRDDADLPLTKKDQNLKEFLAECRNDGEISELFYNKKKDVLNVKKQ
jgi:hypothetical protein